MGCQTESGFRVGFYSGCARFLLVRDSASVSLRSTLRFYISSVHRETAREEAGQTQMVSSGPARAIVPPRGRLRSSNTAQIGSLVGPRSSVLIGLRAPRSWTGRGGW